MAKFHYPPFGFSVWYDRHKGRRWCWVERLPTGHDDDVVEGEHFRSRRLAIQSIRDELRRRGERDARAAEEALASAEHPTVEAE